MTVSVEKWLRDLLRMMALRDGDAASLARAASGGMFSMLARLVLRAGSVVFGAELLPGGVVRHAGVESVDKLPRLQGSKYMRSDVVGTFGRASSSSRASRRPAGQTRTYGTLRGATAPARS